MIKHIHTNTTSVNFLKLEERIFEVNDSNLCKVEEFKDLLLQLSKQKCSTLIMATGGSKVVAYYLQLVLERIGLTGNICEVIEPRDYFYKPNKEMFSNLVVVSTSGNTNGVQDALINFSGQKYLICEQVIDKDCFVVSWANELYEKEKSFISLASSLCPITLLLDGVEALNLPYSHSIQDINYKIKKLLECSSKKIDSLSFDFRQTQLFHILSGYDTKVSSSALESNLVEAGIGIPIVHDKGSFCHGRSNLLFQNPESVVFYLEHQRKELDDMLLYYIDKEYANVSVFDTEEINDSIYWKEYYLLLQMYFLSKKIANDKNMELTQPEYNPQLVKKFYKFKGVM